MPPEQPEAERVFFSNLDGLRFLAFFLVYLQHGFGVAYAAGAGVAFFFVLSGFLITYLILAEVDKRGSFDIWAFYIRRALRIWPLYFAVMAFAFLVYPMLKTAAGYSGYAQNGGPLLYLLFLGNFDVLRLPVGEGAGFTNVTWSVSIEEQFYLLWALLFRLVPPKRFLGIFLSVILISFGFRLLHANDDQTLYFHSLSVVSDMAIGGLAAYLWRQKAQLRSSFSAMPRSYILTIYAAGLLFFWAVSPWGPYARLVVAIFFALVVLEQNFCLHSPFKMSAAPLLSELGRYTYGLYMLHLIVLLALEKGLILLRIDAGSMPWRWFLPPLGLLLSIGVARISFLYFESPFLRVKDRFSRMAPAPNRSA